MVIITEVGAFEDGGAFSAARCRYQLGNTCAWSKTGKGNGHRLDRWKARE
jgi:hypothetical protein